MLGISTLRSGRFALPLLCLAWLCAIAIPAQGNPPTPVHGLALYGEPALPADFSHFSYVDPEAPRGGSLTRAAVGDSFDSTNPFILRGTPAAGLGQTYDSLTTANPDEPFSVYGLIAETLLLDPERRWIEYALRPEARFHDGEPITAEDVAFSFELLMEEGTPSYRSYYAEVSGVEVLDAHRVRFSFVENASRELPLIIGELPILPRHYWEARDFTRPDLEAHPGSGPYRIARVDPGRRIVYERVEDYWGEALPVNRGRHNIDRLVYDYFRDRDIAMEAFKAGLLDLRIDARAATWATGYDFPAYRDGSVRRLTIPDGTPATLQGYVFNLRKPRFQDPRVREALSLTFDFPWLNANLFYDSYARTQSAFQNSELAAEGLPSEAELALLEPLREHLDPRVFSEPMPLAEPEGLRERLRRAHDLLLEAGYVYRDRRLVHGDSGEPLRLEMLLFDTGMERVAQPMLRNMARLGVETSIRIVDVNQYLNRLRSFDFDMVTAQFPQSNNPGNEQRSYWTSEAAEIPLARNLMGLADPAVDALVEGLIRAESREALIAYTRALDRVLRLSFAVIPHYHSGETRLALWDKFGHPAPFPRYGNDFAAWWVDPAKSAEITRRQRGR